QESEAVQREAGVAFDRQCHQTRHVGHADGVAVGLGACDLAQANTARRTGTVDYDHGLAQFFFQVTGQYAGRDVGTTARCEADDQLDLLLRPRLCGDVGSKRAGNGHQQAGDECALDLHVVLLFSSVELKPYVDTASYSAIGLLCMPKKTLLTWL